MTKVSFLWFRCVRARAHVWFMLVIVILFNTVPAASCSVYFPSISIDKISCGLTDAGPGAIKARSFRNRLALANTR